MPADRQGRPLQEKEEEWDADGKYHVRQRNSATSSDLV